jgi:hypothetical protein
MVPPVRPVAPTIKTLGLDISLSGLEKVAGKDSFSILLCTFLSRNSLLFSYLELELMWNSSISKIAIADGTRQLDSEIIIMPRVFLHKDWHCCKSYKIIRSIAVL